MPSPGAPGGGALESCREILSAGLSAAASSWGPFDLTLPRFEARAAEIVARRLSRSGTLPTPDRVREIVARMPLADLAIAVACSEDVPGAWETLVERLSPRLSGLARKHGAGEVEARTLASDVLSEVSIPTRSGAARRLIDTYEASGSLFGWTAVILVRRLRRERGRQRGHGRGTEEPVSARDEPADRGAGPLAAQVEADGVRRFREALAAAWASLSGRERLALSCRYMDDMPQTRISKVLRVSEPHTSRILAAAIARLRAALEGTLGAETAGPEGARGALAETLRQHLVSTRADLPLPIEEIPRSRGPR